MMMLIVFGYYEIYIHACVCIYIYIHIICVTCVPICSSLGSLWFRKRFSLSYHPRLFNNPHWQNTRSTEQVTKEQAVYSFYFLNSLHIITCNRITGLVQGLRVCHQVLSMFAKSPSWTPYLFGSGTTQFPAQPPPWHAMPPFFVVFSLSYIPPPMCIQNIFLAVSIEMTLLL